MKIFIFWLIIIYLLIILAQLNLNAILGFSKYYSAMVPLLIYFIIVGIKMSLRYDEQKAYRRNTDQDEKTEIGQIMANSAQKGILNSSQHQQFINDCKRRYTEKRLDMIRRYKRDLLDILFIFKK